MSKVDAEQERDAELARDMRAARDGLKQVPRRSELLALEGWYEYDRTWYHTVRFKLTCRFRDFLRCSIWRGHARHFNSCFSPGGQYYDAPWILCGNPNVAMIYLPDVHGNFQARAWVKYEDTSEIPELMVYKVYGNGLDEHDIEKVYSALGLRCSAVEWDVPY